MPYLSNTTSVAVASAGLIGLVLANAMGLFSKNRMPVDGKVCSYCSCDAFGNGSIRGQRITAGKCETDRTSQTR